MTIPNQAIMGVPGLRRGEAMVCARAAVKHARSIMPRVSGATAKQVRAIWGDEWFGLEWNGDHVWYQESGTKAFTMKSLAGKTIPMWVDDADGKEAKRNPKAKTRVTKDGRRQVLIFRRAARVGSRRMQPQVKNGVVTRVSKPAAYPGAPGRIAVNQSRRFMRHGDRVAAQGNPGAITRSNTGVRWRHPGLHAGRHMALSVTYAALDAGLPIAGIQYINKWTSQQVGPLVTVVYEG